MLSHSVPRRRASDNRCRRGLARALSVSYTDPMRINWTLILWFIGWPLSHLVMDVPEEASEDLSWGRFAYLMLCALPILGTILLLGFVFNG